MPLLQKRKRQGAQLEDDSNSRIVKTRVPTATNSLRRKASKKARSTTKKIFANFPIELLYMVLVELARLGRQEALVAALVSKKWTTKLLPYAMDGARVHWMNLECFQNQVIKARGQRVCALPLPLARLTIDLQMTNEPRRNCVPHKRYDPKGPISAVAKFVIPIADLQSLDLYTRADINHATFRPLFSSSVEHLSCRETGIATTQDVRYWGNYLTRSGTEPDPKSSVFPKCKSLLIDFSKDAGYAFCQMNVFEFPALEYLYLLTDYKVYRSNSPLYYIDRTKFPSSTKVAIILRYGSDEKRPSEKSIRKIHELQYNRLSQYDR
jgi:hypothetical protein